MSDVEINEKAVEKSNINVQSEKMEIDLLAEKAVSLGVPYLNKSPKINKHVIDLISEDVAKKYKMAAFERDEGVVKVAMVDPQDLEALNVLRFIAENLKVEFEIYLSSQEIFEDIIDQYGAAEKAVAEAMKSLQESEYDELFEVDTDKKKDKDKSEVIQDAPVTKLLSVIIKHAIEGKASDIHIEPIEKECRVRFRVDGVLHSSLSIPKEVGRAVISRIKILSNLKIDEKRKPQDGRFRVTEDGKPVDFRVSTLPVVDGEKVVLRLLAKGDKKIDLEGMGLYGRGREIMLKHIKDPFGIILITGPTGSGKSTTLYSFLQMLNQEERNIITLEDPVEYSIEGINQSQIKPEIGYTFASGLRSILRQDPNVIMVGEIRDGETAELSIHAALTGHLVFSTLHTNSSIGAIPRMIDMGIESFLLSSSLQVVAAQRLVRRICEKCREEIEIPHSVMEFVKNEIENVDKGELEKYDLDLSGGLRFYQGKGCEACSNTGYKGRIAIFEALEIDGEIKLIMNEQKDSEGYIEKRAREQGMVTIKQDGIMKALKGLTTLSEVERVTEGTMSIGGDVDDDKG